MGLNELVQHQCPGHLVYAFIRKTQGHNLVLSFRELNPKLHFQSFCSFLLGRNFGSLGFFNKKECQKPQEQQKRIEMANSI